MRLAPSTRTHLILAALAALLAAPGAAAGAQAGNIVASEGKAEVGRNGTWTPAVSGATVEVGDKLRTGYPGRVRIVLLDQSVLNIGDDSVFIIDEHVYKADEGTANSVMRLLKGKVRSLVSEYYDDPLAGYQIETVTAVSGVRGTEFIVVHNEDTGETEVVGIEGRIEVHGTVDRNNGSVLIEAGQMTNVESGGFPAPPQPIGEERLRGFMRGLQARSSAHGESVAFTAPVLSGTAIPVEETAAPSAPPKTPQGGQPAAPPPPLPESFDDNPTDERATPSDAVDQPAPVLERRGELEVQFQRAPRTPRR